MWVSDWASESLDNLCIESKADFPFLMSESWTGRIDELHTSRTDEHVYGCGCVGVQVCGKWCDESLNDLCIECKVDFPFPVSESWTCGIRRVVGFKEIGLLLKLEHK